MKARGQERILALEGGEEVKMMSLDPSAFSVCEISILDWFR